MNELAASVHDFLSVISCHLFIHTYLIVAISLDWEHTCTNSGQITAFRITAVTVDLRVRPCEDLYQLRLSLKWHKHYKWNANGIRSTPSTTILPRPVPAQTDHGVLHISISVCNVYGPAPVCVRLCRWFYFYEFIMYLDCEYISFKH